MSLKFCANLNFLFTENGKPILERFRLAKQAGFRAVENGFPASVSVSDAVAVQQETGLEVALLNICLGTFEGGENGCVSVPNREKEFKENLALTVQYAKALKCKKIHLMAGKVVGPVTQQHHDTYERNLRHAAEVLAPESIVGVIEPICVYGVPGYYLNSYTRAIEVIHRINSPNIRLMLDVYHCQHIQGNLTNSINDLIPLIGHVQVAQVPGRNEPNTAGELNYGHIFKTLEAAGYKSWIGCEYRPASGSTTDGLGWISEYGYSL